jgi:Zn-dependent peptidase ImmA (M78 family)/transcriptional regulator with XRE-family HTH domain
MNSPTFNRHILLLARQYRAMSQAEVAAAAKIDQGHYSKIENGLLPHGPSEETLQALARALRFPASYFRQTDHVYGLPISIHPMHRKRASVGERALRRIHADLNLRLVHLRRLLNAIDLKQHFTMPQIDVDEGGGAERVAEAVRKAWLIPPGPFVDLTGCVERAGGLVVFCNFADADVDGVTLRAPDLPPCIFLNQTAPADRLRFSLAHELAHVVMHHVPTATMEDEADIFARSLLMPAKDIKKDLVGRLTLEKLGRLKLIWRVSMQALLMRATDLGTVTANQSQYLWRQISSLGYRKREPAELDFEAEKPGVFPRLIGIHLQDLGYTTADLAKALHLDAIDMPSLYGLEVTPARGRLRVVK